MNSVHTLLRSPRRRKTVGIVATALVFSSGVCLAYYKQHAYPEHPKGAMQSRSQIAARALQICAALNGSGQLIAPPTLQSEQGRLPDGSLSKEKLWLALAESSHAQVNMLFNDKTGRLVCLMMEQPHTEKQNKEQAAPIDTENEAVAVAIARLKAMQVLPPGVQIALEERPRQERDGQTWSLNWLVKEANARQPYRLRLGLMRRTGQPVCMVTMQETSIANMIPQK